MFAFRSMIIACLILLVALPALAQDEPLLEDGEGTEVAPPPPPPPPPAPAPAPATQPAPQHTRPATKVEEPASPADGLTPRKRKDLTDTDHDMVIGDIGFQVVFISNIGPMMTSSGQGQPLTVTGKQTDAAIADPPSKSLSGASMANVGIRTWFTRRVGLDAGLGLFIGKEAKEDVDTQLGFSMSAGVPIALGVYRHVTMFAGPEVGFALWHIAEETNQWLFNLKGKAGIELSLGFIDIPRVSFIGSMALGLRLYGDGNNTEIVLGNDAGFSLESLFESCVGLVFYI